MAGLLALGLAGPADAACRQALALGLDVSGSVDSLEYRLQADGLAAALENPDVQAALFSMPGAPVVLAVYEWSGPEAQRLLVGWTEIAGPEALAAVTARLRAADRGIGAFSTAIGSAKAFGAALLAERRDCWKRTLDLSGDGKSNTGPRPQDVRPGGITVNGLVIGQPETGGREPPGVAELGAYFRAYVLEGDDAFLEIALGFEDFEAAMTRKLLRELEVMVVSRRQAR
nr:DUF1194 domain-containing protein [Thalassococcus arenae]